MLCVQTTGGSAEARPPGGAGQLVRPASSRQPGDGPSVQHCSGDAQRQDIGAANNVSASLFLLGAGVCC